MNFWKAVTLIAVAVVLITLGAAAFLSPSKSGESVEAAPPPTTQQQGSKNFNF